MMGRTNLAFYLFAYHSKVLNGSLLEDLVQKQNVISSRESRRTPFPCRTPERTLLLQYCHN